MSISQEPFDSSEPGENSQEPLDARIRRLIDSQRYAVLCTQGQGQIMWPW